MNTLAIETSEPLGSLAAMCNDQLIADRQLNPAQRSAESLAPGIKALLGDVGWKADDVDLVAVTIGPGSFTGLRVGVTTAKTLAFCCGADVIGINTLETIAAAAPSDVQRLTVAIDAQRNEVVVQAFNRDSGGHFLPEPTVRHAGSATRGTPGVIDIDIWLQTLGPGTLLSGSILKKLLDRLPEGVSTLPPQCWRARAANVARLAVRDYADGRRDDIWKLAPLYSRKSAAEEKWEQTQAPHGCDTTTGNEC